MPEAQICYGKDEEYLACVRDILEHPVFQSMDHFIQHGHTTCKTHCIQVSYLSYKICRKHGWDFVAAARAGLLHDLFLYDWHTHARETGNYFHGYTHPRVAMENAVKYFGISKKEQRIILCHMWPLTPVPPMSMAGMAIVWADKFCSLAEVGGHVKRWCTGVLERKRIA
ncbi:HD domain-containing protein [Lachnospiraceae bacterium 62-35]